MYISTELLHTTSKFTISVKDFRSEYGSTKLYVQFSIMAHSNAKRGDVTGCQLNYEPGVLPLTITLHLSGKCFTTYRTPLSKNDQ